MIHYHGTPISGTRDDAVRFLSGRHALVSFFAPGDMPIVAEVCQSYCIDNGAFSAWKSGEPIVDWTPYYSFCRLWARHPGFDFCLVPDVIDGTEEQNDALVEEWRRDVLPERYGAPVWHLHESLERLHRLVFEWPRVALGSSGRWANPGTPSWWERMAEAMAVACDPRGRPHCKLHGLRMLDPAIFHRLPLASADSTNAVRNASLEKRFGMYVPPSSGTRMTIIAERVEAHNSAAVWVPREEQRVIAFMGNEIENQ